MAISRRSTRLPKKVACVRVAKKLRTMDGKLVEMISSPLVAALAAPVLISGAVAIRNKAVRAAAVKARDKARGAVRNLTERAGSLATAVGAGEGL